MSAESTFEETELAGLRPEIWKHLFGFAKQYPRCLYRVALFAMGTGVADMSFPLITKQLVDAITAWYADRSVPAPSLWPYGLAYFALMLLLCGSVLGFIRSVGFLKTSVSADIRQACFHNLQRLEFAYYDQRATGWLMSRLTGDCERLANIMAWGLLDVVWSTIFLIGITCTLLVLHWKLGLLVLVVVPLLLVVSRKFQSRLLLASRKIRRIASAITASFNESIMGVLTTKAFAQQAPNLAQFDARIEGLHDASVRSAVLSALYLPTVLTVGSLATALVLVQGGFAVTVGSMGLGTLVAFLAYTRLMFEPLQQLAHIFSELQMAQASGERIVELLSRQPAIVDSPAVQAAITRQTAEPKPDVAHDGGPRSVGAIEFDRVGFRYGAGQGGDRPVLSDITLRVEPGETVALVGSTGGGKTTLVSLLCRFYEPTTGEIRIGGSALRERSLGWLQSIFGVVLQDPYLFRASVRENIRYGQLDASDTEVEAAARLVGAHEFIEALPGGYAFDVGAGGLRLSQGQRQLVSFARALLKDPDVLIMDEATSNIDTETEQHIQQGLQAMLRGRTSFLIAHRLSTIERADRILVIEGGRIVEQGSHSFLLAQRGRYFDLLKHQDLEDIGGRSSDWNVKGTTASHPAIPSRAGDPGPHSAGT